MDTKFSNFIFNVFVVPVCLFFGMIEMVGAMILTSAAGLVVVGILTSPVWGFILVKSWLF